VPALEIRGLVKRLGQHLAVDEVSFTVEDEEFFVLLGSSGCGKSTTLRVICGLEQPDAGQVILAGRDVTRLPSRERNLGMVFQEYGLYPSMDVFGNMAYGLQARGELPRKEIERRVLAAAERLGLTPHLRSPITDLSGGEQQRVALGRAMSKDADAYLYDEPLSNLDPKLRHQVRRDITAMHREKGKPTVYVTHDQIEAFAMGDRIAVMSRGRIQQIGPPHELADHPANTFVASFLGSPPMNLLPGRLTGCDGAPGLIVADTRLPLSFPTQAVGEVTVGIKPDALRPVPDGADGLKCEVEHVEPLLGETVARFRLAGGGTLQAVFRDGDDPRVGETLRLAVDPAGIRLFDLQTEQAITP
jgi:multiple sugar transport system ATP-binding protein